MKVVQHNIFYLLIGFSLAFISCKKGKEMTTNDGFRYILYTDAKGPNPKIGDYLTLDLVYRDANDSILFDSGINKKPLRFPFESIPFKGSYEDGLTYLCAGDSATFYVPADSLYKYYFLQKGNTIRQEETSFKKGTFLKFDIKLLKIQDRVEAEQEMMMDKSERERAGKKIFEDYITEHKLEAFRDSAGYCMTYVKHGSGIPLDTSMIISVNYKGKFLTGTVFDSNEHLQHPYRFVLGQRQVIYGWELAIKKLKIGDEINLLLPSELAYGENGFRDPRTGAFIVPSYAPLLFEIQIVDAQPVQMKTAKK